MSQVDEMNNYMRMLQAREEEDRLQALRGLVRLIGEQAEVYLLSGMGDNSWRVRKEATELFFSLPFSERRINAVINLLYSQDNAGLRNAAVEVLIRLGREAVPALLRELHSHDHDVRKFALDILGEIKVPETAQAMIAALDDPDENVRAAAVENLGKLRVQAAVPHLLQRMKDADLWLQFNLLDALGRIDGAVPVENLFGYANVSLLRKPLFDCLGRVGNPAALPLLLEGMEDNRRNVRDAAIHALSSILRQNPDEAGKLIPDLWSSDGTRILMEVLDTSGDLKLKLACLRLLGCSKDGHVAPALLKFFNDESLREGVLDCLKSLGQSAAQFLVSAWPSANDQDRAYIAYLLGDIGGPQAFDLLVEGLGHEDLTLRMACARSLGTLGHIQALPYLVACLEQPEREFREVALQALITLGSRFNDETAAILLPLLEHDNDELRRCVVTVLGRLDSNEVVAPLAFALKDESSFVRRAAVQGLDGKFGPESLPSLSMALTDEDSEVRRLAAEVLGGCTSPEVVKPLKLALQDEDIWVRAAAVRSLGRRTTPEIFQMLTPILQDPVGLVAIAVLETLAVHNIDESYPFLVEAVGHNDEEVVSAALQLLQKTGRIDWVSLVFDRLAHHPAAEVRINFAKTIVLLGGDERKGLLEKLVSLEKDAGVREFLRELILDLPNSGIIN